MDALGSKGTMYGYDESYDRCVCAKGFPDFSSNDRRVIIRVFLHVIHSFIVDHQICKQWVLVDTLTSKGKKLDPLKQYKECLS